MNVRAKFRLNSYTTELQATYPHYKADGQPDYTRPVQVEKRTLNLTPVYGSGSDENKAFWDATPTGSLQLGVVNQQAWAAFELGKSYYVDFSEAD